MVIHLNVANVILEKRKQKNITQEELAKFLMVTKASVSKWETGQSHPDIMLLPKLASFFNISKDELLGYQPQLSDQQIRKVILDLVDHIEERGFQRTFDICKELIQEYYSCFSFLYAVGLFLLNNLDMIENESTDNTEVKNETVIFLKNIFERILNESDDLTLQSLARSLYAVCLLNLHEPKRVIEILPETDRLLSDEALLVSAYLQTDGMQLANTKIQVYIYKELFNLFQLLMMKLDMDQHGWEETGRKIEGIIKLFNMDELNFALALQYYILMAKKWILSGDIDKASDYAEMALIKMNQKPETVYELNGDNYFNEIDDWLDSNLVLGKKGNRNKLTIQQSIKNVFYTDPILKLITSEERILTQLNQLS